jgi:dienelactone hydrolase
MVALMVQGASKPLAVSRSGARIPALVWNPSGRSEGVVLACHGGSGHKTSGAVLAIAEAFTSRGFTVLAIDGPVHGERRTDGNLAADVARASFRAAWREGIGRIDMARDMSAALDALMLEAQYAGLPVGYIGVSMGTAYGIPLLAEDERIAAAAVGLWSTTYPSSEHLAAYARQIRCAVWFTQQWNDEFFDRAGTSELFDAIGSADKRMVTYPGPHRELEGERLVDAVTFLTGRLKR